MSLKRTLSSGLTRLLFTVYTERTERLTKWLGIHSALASAYWAVQSRVHDNMATVTVGRHEATFAVSTVWEFYRFHDLMGEDVVLLDLLEEIRSDDVFFDVGANVGMYTCFVSQQLPAEQVVAFEPHPANASTLRDNLELNGTSATIKQCGLAGTETEGALAVGPEGAGEGRHALATDEGSETITIDLHRGNELIDRDEVPSPTILKVDVEGAEVGVLEGMTQALETSCRLCYIEVHPDRITEYDRSQSDLHSILESHGFELETIHERGEDEYFLKARRSLTDE